MKTALYARVSTTAQDAEMQKSELREYCQRRGWEVSQEYVDVRISGTRQENGEGLASEIISRR
jgi:DNA invertase Pin-like site-specific DNA recombinase